MFTYTIKSINGLLCFLYSASHYVRYYQHSRCLAYTHVKATTENSFIHYPIDYCEYPNIVIANIVMPTHYIIRGELERAPNTRGTGSGFIYIYMFVG